MKEKSSFLENTFLAVRQTEAIRTFPVVDMYQTFSKVIDTIVKF